MIRKLFGSKAPTRTVEQIVHEAIDDGTFFVDLDGVHELSEIAKTAKRDPKELNEKVTAMLIVCKSVTEMIEKLHDDEVWEPVLQNVFEDYVEQFGLNYKLVERCINSIYRRRPELNWYDKNGFVLGAMDKERGRQIVAETEEDQEKLAALRAVLFPEKKEADTGSVIESDDDASQESETDGESILDQMQRELDAKKT